jgi:hypothetical protein
MTHGLFLLQPKGPLLLMIRKKLKMESITGLMMPCRKNSVLVTRARTNDENKVKG